MVSLTRAITFLVISAFMVSIVSVQPVVAQSQPFTVIQSPSHLFTFNMTVNSPKNDTAYTNIMLIDYSLEISTNLTRSYGYGYWYYYRIDNNSEIWIKDYQYNYREFFDVTNLTNGIHQLTIIGKLDYFQNKTGVQDIQVLSQTEFSVSNKPVTIHILSPQNTIYFAKNIPLTFEIDNPSSYNYPIQHYYIHWFQGYRLDNGTREQQNLNDTLNGLTDGIHNLTFYVEIGNMSSSQNVSFVVIATSSDQSLMMAAIVLIVSILLVSLFLYRRHRKTSEQQTV
jgi:hypothetical protein